MKSVLVDFLVSAGIKPVSIVSYNHLDEKPDHVVVIKYVPYVGDSK
eukprot:gene29365-38447_t